VRRKLLSISHSYVVALNRRLVHELSRAGRGTWEVTAVAPRAFQGANDLRAVTLEREENEPCQLVDLPAHCTGRPHLFFFGSGIRQVLNQGWDLIHCWEEPFITAGWQIARLKPANTPMILASFQNLAKNYPPPFCWFERDTLRRSAGWIAFGRTVFETLRDRPAYAQRPWRIITPGVDTDVFHPDAHQRRSVRRRLQWDETGPPVVGFLGRFLPEKGLDLLMSVLAAQQSPWRALFVGAGPMESKLRGWATSFGDNVRICCDVRHADVPAYLNAMDMLCAPSQTLPRWREQFGRMLIEAFACGVPLLGSDSGEIPHVLGGAGIVLGEKDQAAWESAVARLLNDRARRRALGEAGLERAHERFAWPVVARQHLEFMESVLERRNARHSA